MTTYTIETDLYGATQYLSVNLGFVEQRDHATPLSREAAEKIVAEYRALSEHTQDGAAYAVVENRE